MTLRTMYGPVQVFFYHTFLPKGQRVTIARVKLEGFPSAWGIAVCSISDRFCREIGRKVALSRALHPLVSGQVKEVRAAIWRAYFER